jgi:hypothetical protein
MNNNSAVQVYVIPEYPDVIFHGMSHLRSARCVLHAPHTVLSRPLFIHFHLPLRFFYYYPYYSFSPLIFYFSYFPCSLVFLCLSLSSYEALVQPWARTTADRANTQKHLWPFAITSGRHIGEWFAYWVVTALRIYVVALITQGFLKPRVTTRHESLVIDRKLSASQHKQANFTS